MFRAPCLAQQLFVRPTLIAACLAVSLTAQAESFTLQLPAQPLATSLSQVAQQAKIQLLFDEDLLKNIQAPALNGDFTPEVAIRTLLNTGAFTLIKVGNTYVVRPEESRTTNSASLQLDALSVIGTGNQVDASTVGRSTLSQADIDRLQPNNIASLVQTLPGVTMGGSMKPGGQIINIRGMGEAEDVPMTVDGATKSGFERYQQGTIFIEPEMIKNVEVEKGPHSARTRPSPVTAGLAARSTWSPKMHRTCSRTGATAVRCSSTGMPATTTNRSTPAPCMAAPRTGASTPWPT